MSSSAFTDATRILAAAADELHNCFQTVHPAGDCLPLPHLVTPSDQGEWAKGIIALAKNLFTDRGDHRAERWINARERCCHLDADQVIGVYEVVYRWYQLLIAAREHVNVVHPCRRLHDLGAAKARFDAELAALESATSRAGPQIGTPQ